MTGGQLTHLLARIRGRVAGERAVEPSDQELLARYVTDRDESAFATLVQLFQLKYGRDLPALRTGNTWEGLDALHAAGLLGNGEHALLRSSYDFLRLVESRLRIVHNRSLDELPEAPEDLEKLARRLGCEPDVNGSAGQSFLADLERHQIETRELILHLVERERSARPGNGGG